MVSLTQQVQDAIQRRGLLREGQRVLLAVSGGVDSMVLQHLLQEASKAQGWRLTVAHLNHQLRGRSSDSDERLVKRTAKKLGLQVVVERTDVRSRAQKEKLSLEMAARKARHEFLARTASRLKIGTVALAHHVDDQLELFFLRLLRGSGGEGLGGMKWRSRSPSNGRIELIRPLLEQSKAAIQAYAHEKRVPFREDATNASLDIRRNRIRHELLPLLRRQYQPALDATVVRCMDIIGAESDFVSRAAEAWLESKTEPFDQLPIALQRRCLYVQLLKNGIEPDYDLIENLRQHEERPISFSLQRGQVLRDRDGTIHMRERTSLKFNESFAELDLTSGRGETTFDCVRIRWQVQMLKTGRTGLAFIQRPSGPPSRDPGGVECFDKEAIGEQVILRHWRPGDRFQPIGMAFASKLQDFFVNQKIPTQERRRLVIACTASGEIFWVEGQRISERFKLTKYTKRGLQWRWERV